MDAPGKPYLIRINVIWNVVDQCSVLVKKNRLVHISGRFHFCGHYH